MYRYIYYINSLDAIHIVATSQGYEGSQLSEEEGVEIESSSVFEYSYLSNQVVHLKGIAEHYIDDTQRQYIINFFESSESELSNDGEIIRHARTRAFEIIENDPKLKCNQDIKFKLLKDYKHMLEFINIG